MAQPSGSMEDEHKKETKNDNTSTESVISGYSNVNEYSQQALRGVLEATRSSNDLPTGDDYDFYSTYSSVRDVLDIEGKRILHLIKSILRQQNVKSSMSSTSDAIDLEDKFDVLMDANDQILERVGSSLDEASGIKKPEAALVVATATPKTATAASWNKAKSSASPSSTFRLLAARNIQRPQLRFKDKIDNTNRPFIPQIKDKPNAQISLDESLKLPENITLEDLERPDFVYPHPYHYELDHLQPTASQLREAKPQEPLTLEATPLKIIDKKEDLFQLIKYLKTVTEVAVDLEAHSYRTFQGITCLMQISTRARDYIVDTLALREHIHLLNEVFTNPAIVKVFHGSEGDIEWLQRDFSVYVVNMFDTGQAARVLQHSRFSLAHLLKIYCQVDADKQYQLADWRIRPLPDELIKYAREDTHYLLYIYDKMKTELIQQGNSQKNLLTSVYSRSCRLCAQVYRKPVFRGGQCEELYKKSKKIFNSQQQQALREIFSWRNKVARSEDESIGYVLPNHMMLQMAEILPREKQGVLACCNPIPPLVRQNLSEIHNIILQAREAPLVKMDVPKAVYPLESHHPKYDSNSLLNCPHDLSHPNNLLDTHKQPDSCLIANSSSMFMDNSIQIALRDKALITAFSWTSERDDAVVTAAGRRAETIRRSFLSPFQMYLPGKRGRKPGSSTRDTAAPSQTVSPWKLKPNTAVEEEEDTNPDTQELSPETDPLTGQPVHVYEPPKKRMKVDTVTNPTITQEEMETEVPLRQDMPKKKKKKRKHEAEFEAEVPASMQDGPLRGNFLGAEEEELPKEEEEEELSLGNVQEEHMKRKKKKKKKGLEEMAEGFQPYDYGAADKSIFQGGSNSKGEFNPGDGKFHKGKKDKRHKNSNRGGNKSFTFKPGGHGNKRGKH